MSKSVISVAVIASFLLCYTCANPVHEFTTQIKVENAPVSSPTVLPATKDDNGTSPLVKNEIIASNKTAENVTTAPDIAPKNVDPQNHNITTSSTTSTTTITPAPAPKTTTIAPTPYPNTTTIIPSTIPTTSATTTKKTNPTTTKPSSTTEPSKPTTAPTVAPHDRKFDGPSFIGGIILACGLTAIGFVAFKFYKARTEHNYHTL